MVNNVDSKLYKLDKVKYMRFVFIIILLGLSFSDSSNMQLIGHLQFDQDCSDITGFYQDEREFAVIGLQNAASFVDVTNPYEPFEIGRIEGSNSIC